jgi:hypothetical protein
MYKLLLQLVQQQHESMRAASGMVLCNAWCVPLIAPLPHTLLQELTQVRRAALRALEDAKAAAAAAYESAQAQHAAKISELQNELLVRDYAHP